MTIHDITRRNRWLSFDDSWSIDDVSCAFDLAQVTACDTVVDPFIGCGTTALVGLARDIPVIGSDISPLAVLTAQMKCHVAYEWEIKNIRTFFQGYSWQTIALAIAQQQLDTIAPRHLARQILACFVVATYRSGWQLDGDMSQLHFERVLDELLAEIQEDQIGVEFPDTQCDVYCADFRARPLLRAGTTSTVLISSPPFFGSRSHALRQLFDKVLVPYVNHVTDGIDNDVFDCWREVVVSQPYIVDLFAHDTPAVIDYTRMLCDVAVLCKSVSCRAAVLEMGPVQVDGQWIRFEDILAQLLLCVGFDGISVERVNTASEPVYRIYAYVRSGHETD